MYVSHYNRNYFEKYIVNQNILINKMCLEFAFTYAVQISSRSVNPLSYIYIYENYNRNYLEKYIENRKILMLRIQFYIYFTN